MLKKKFLIIFIVAFLASCISLLHFKPENPCGSYGILAKCFVIPPSRGFPFIVRLEDYEPGHSPTIPNVYPLITYQLGSFILNAVFYFIVFGLIYFAYLVLTGKKKKK